MALYSGPGTPTTQQGGNAAPLDKNGQQIVPPLDPTWAFARQVPATAEQWETAAPDADALPMVGLGGSVVEYRGGAGDQPGAAAVDDWLLRFRDVPHAGAVDGIQLFERRPVVPPEGHGGFDIVGDEGVFIDRATQTQYFGWSDWAASTAAQAGGRGSFTGEHVIIARIAPGSARGYQPAEMLSPNQDRNMPAPWDAAITIGQAAATVAGS